MTQNVSISTKCLAVFPGVAILYGVAVLCDMAVLCGVAVLCDVAIFKLAPFHRHNMFLYYITQFHWKFIGSYTIFRDAMNLDITSCHALIHGFSENVDASSSRGKTDGNHLYLIRVRIDRGRGVESPPQPPKPIILVKI